MRQRSFTTHEGNAFYINRLDAYSDAGGDRSEWDKIPEADRNVHTWLSFNMTRYDRTIRLSGEVINSGGSVVDPLSDEMSKAMKAAVLDGERTIFRSYLGDLADVVSCSTSKTLAISSWQWIGGATNGMRIDVLVKSSGALGNGVYNARINGVTRNDAGTATITIDTDLGDYLNVGSTYAIFRHNTYAKGPFGLPDVVSATDPTGKDYGGVDRDVVEEHKAQTHDALNQSIDAKIFAQAATKVELYGNGMMPTVWWVHPYVHNDLLRIARRDARFPGERRSFEQWGETVFINNVPVLRSRFCPFDTCYGLHEPSFRWAHPKKMPKGMWRRSGGNAGSVLLPVTGYWGWEALWVWQRQLVCADCNSNVIISNIAWNVNGTV
jgi:hypothetical protein